MCIFIGFYMRTQPLGHE